MSKPIYLAIASPKEVSAKPRLRYLPQAFCITTEGAMSPSWIATIPSIPSHVCGNKSQKI